MKLYKPDAPGEERKPPFLDPIRHPIADHHVVHKVNSSHAGIVLAEHVGDQHLYSSRFTHKTSHHVLSHHKMSIQKKVPKQTI